MKKKDVPQDDANMFEGKLKEPCYVVDEDGKYTTVKSVGWEAKNVVMQQAWDAVHEKVEEVKRKVEKGELSPIAYYMEKQVMDLSVLKGYTGYFKWKIKCHLKMKHFNKLKDHQLQKYAEAFDLDVQTLKNKELR